MKDLSLYVHVPFCTRRCPYCSFYHVQSDPGLQAAFVETIAREIRLALGEPPSQAAVRTVYFGGGTPSVLDETSWKSLFRALEPYLDSGLTKEITCELNPEDVEEPFLALLADAGVNRVSLGIQSMVPRAQTILKRCSPGTNTEAIKKVVARFSNVNFDLLLGIPGGSLEELKQTVEILTRYSPAHLSVYCLEPGGDLDANVTGFFSDVDVDRSGEEYLRACEHLRGLGYVHYEVSNFALPGRESLHNRCYWEGGEYIGLGPGAHSFTGGRRFHNRPSLRVYLSGGGTGSDTRVYDRRGPEAAETERFMLALRTNRGAPLHWARCGSAVIRDIVENGLGRIEAGRLVLTDRGYLVTNDIVLRLMTG